MRDVGRQMRMREKKLVIIIICNGNGNGNGNGRAVSSSYSSSLLPKLQTDCHYEQHPILEWPIILILGVIG